MYEVSSSLPLTLVAPAPAYRFLLGVRSTRRGAPSRRGSLECSRRGKLCLSPFPTSLLIALGSHRQDVTVAVFRTPGQLYKGHFTVRAAHIHYADMLRKGLVEAKPGYRGKFPLPSPTPTPAGLPPPPETSLTTYVVTQGRRVGVFRDW